MDTLLKSLSVSPLFHGIDLNNLYPLLECLTFKQREYNEGETIIHEGERVESIGILLSGSAHIVMNDFWGNKNIISNLMPGEIFSEVYALSGANNLSGVEVISSSASEILFLNFKKMIHMCSGACSFHNTLISNLIRILGEKNLTITEKMRCLSKRSTREKLLAYFSLESKKQGKTKIIIPYNRQELADYLFVDRSAMSSELSKMQDEGLIEYRKNTFYLKKLADY